MKKTIVIDSIFDYERTALLENGELKEIIFTEKSSFNIGDILVARIKKILPNKFIFLDIGDEKNAFLCLTDKKEKHLFQFDENKKKDVLKVKEGQEIIVQIQKEGSDLKGISVTTRLTLTGKYCVLLLNENHLGISKKIEENREALKQMAKEILPEGYGIILRTNCKDISIDILKEELLYLIEKSKKIIEIGQYSKAPYVLYNEKKQYEKMIIDILKDEDEVFLNSEEDFKSLKAQNIFPNINFYKETIPIFEAFSIENQLEKVFNNKIWLKSGAFIIIDNVEAMTIIDVNTGKNIQKDYEKMVLKTNLEAIKECAKQIRLRNLSGIIMIDLIDMKNQDDKNTIFMEMKKLAKEDRQPITIYPINELGILQLTRKKSLKPLSEVIMNTCPFCSGIGKVKNENFIANEIKNRIISILSNTIYNKLIISSNAKIINSLNSFNIQKLGQKFNAKIELNVASKTKFDYFEIEKIKE